VTGRTIVCFSSIDWGESWQVHQEIMSTLARDGNRVLFVESTGVRRAGWRDLARLRTRLRNWRHASSSAHPRPNLHIVSPVALPFPYLGPALWLNSLLLGRVLTRRLRALDGPRPIVWIYLPTPVVLRLVRAIDPLLTVYHCADDFGSSSPQAAPIEASESEILRAADLVLATSARLADRARRHNSNVHLLPAGVAFDRFERARTDGQPPPADLTALPRPIVGFVGGVNHRVDEELVAEAARRLPAFSFVFVGPVAGTMPALARCANVHLLGQRAHEAVPYYIKGFDAGIIPYRVTTYTHHIYPVKLNEYLAMGKPVVSTDLAEVRRHVEEFPGCATIAATASEFAAALERSVRLHDESAASRAVEIARANSWDRRMTRLEALVDAALAARAGPA
jgi:glycosyltransferase involved in cell wall biosynthesis